MVYCNQNIKGLRIYSLIAYLSYCKNLSVRSGRSSELVNSTDNPFGVALIDYIVQIYGVAH